MKIKEVSAKAVLDSRQEETIEVTVNGHATSAPAGKSKGKHEKPSYKKNLGADIKFINSLKASSFKGIEINEFDDLEKIEGKLIKKVGANTLFAFEASVLKASAREKLMPLWQFINPYAKVFPRILSNTIGGGAHSSVFKIKPDFQEFLVTNNKNPAIGNFLNKKSYGTAGKILSNLSMNSGKINDENAWQTDLDNEKVLEVMKNVQENVFEESRMHIDIGLDVAASQFFKAGKYYYKDRIKTLSREQQIKYMVDLSRKFNLFYIEDPLDEEDFAGFASLVKNVNCLIVGDDLTVTNYERVERAIRIGAITGLIVKPNQTGSLIEVKRIIELCNKNCIKTIMSHRSGETMDNTIADLAFAFQCDFIKTPVIGKEREAKVARLMQIEGSSKKVTSEDEEFVRRRHKEVESE